MAKHTEKPSSPVLIVDVGRKPVNREKPGVSLDRDRRWPWLLLAGVALGLVALALVTPGSLLEKITWLTSGICPQRPGHSYFFEGQQMPLEARMTGIFGGFLLTFLGLWLVGRGRALQWPNRRLSLALAGLVLIMVLDGLNSTAFDLGWPVLYPPQNWLRAVTGAVSGVGMAGLLLPVVNLTLWRRGYLTPTFRRGREILYALIPALLLALGTILGWGPLFWPLSLLAVGGVVTMLVMFNLIILAIVLRQENAVSSFYGLLAPASLVIVLSLGQLALFAVLRLALGGAQASL